VRSQLAHGTFRDLIYTLTLVYITREIVMKHEVEEVPADADLHILIRHVVDELKAARDDAYRQRRWMRGMSVALAGLLAFSGWSLLSSDSVAQSPNAKPQQGFLLSSEARAKRRAELVAMLPADKQQDLESFEREVDWLNAYMQTWDEGKAGAVIAMMLFRMGKSMDTMPSMEQQMRMMSGQMGALPAIVGELSQINAKMHVITGTMDSTMGRAGRMIPWMPFSR
jgi:hypothetical protein